MLKTLGYSGYAIHSFTNLPVQSEFKSSSNHPKSSQIILKHPKSIPVISKNLPKSAAPLGFVQTDGPPWMLRMAVVTGCAKCTSTGKVHLKPLTKGKGSKISKEFREKIGENHHSFIDDHQLSLMIVNGQFMNIDNS